MQEDFSKYNGEGTVLRRVQDRMLEILIEVDKICKAHNISYWLEGGTLLGAVRHGGFIPWDDDIDISLMREDYLRLIKILPKELSSNFVFQNEKTDKYYFLKFAKVRDRNSLLLDPLTNPKQKEQGIYIDIFPQETMLFSNMKKCIEYFYGNAFRRSRHFYKSKWKYVSGCILRPFSYMLVVLFRFINKLFVSDKLFPASGVPFYYEAVHSKDTISPCVPIVFEGYEFLAPNKVHDYLVAHFGEDYMQIPTKEKRVAHATKIEFYE